MKDKLMPKRYKITVRLVYKDYTIEADSPREALEKFKQDVDVDLSFKTTARLIK
tara:strand:- start:461 stop:622 length:162 start_codon:yes stop_codon:yes gene_type:complete